MGTMMSRQEVLAQLGPGGTTEMADRVLVMLGAARLLGACSLELAGLSEVCRTLGYSRQQVGHWISGRRGPGGFPEPIAHLSATPVWDLNQVRDWYSSFSSKTSR